MSDNSDCLSVTCQASPNIALIKYWGKRNEELILPDNDSLSITLDLGELHSDTTVSTSSSMTCDTFYFDGIQQTKLSKRMQKVLDEVRRRAKNDQIKFVEIRSHNTFPASSGLASSASAYASLAIALTKLFNLENPQSTAAYLARIGSGLSKRMQKVLDEVRRRAKNDQIKFVEIRSHNTFPASSGLASSASAYASLAIALTKLFNLENPQSTAAYLARIGSGSAVRSVYGGFVRWSSEGECLSSCIYPVEHWPELRLIILIFNSSKKPVSSTDAMQRTRETSTLFQARLSTVNDKIEKLIQAIKIKDFNTFAKIVMMDSSQFHAVCMDTYPPVIYLNEQSKHLIDLVHAFNKTDENKTMKVAYTFDAGPNPFCFIREEHVDEFLSLLKHFYPSNNDNVHKQVSNIDGNFPSINLPIMANALERIVLTKIGSGPKII
ncbi:unnamed protein product [Adineta steineri]|uniref:Diphosphomevalonate decarboxylase n=1 Tax=Adineta steineri TaxID=433720 RepID=A0A813VCU4_9BILA|nr:unnamed protein product [Adineta steineri]